MADPYEAGPCPGSGQSWRRLRSARVPAMCPVCDAGPATLRVPDPGPGEDPLVPDHPNMVAWSGRIDITRRRQVRAVMKPGQPEDRKERS